MAGIERLKCFIVTGLVVTALVAFTSAPARSQSAAKGFEAELRAALDLHDKATSLEEQARALTAFQAATAQNPDRWRGHFWTAYEETQIARLRKRTDPEADLDAYLDRAQSHLSKVEELHTSATPRERSSVAVLQALIYRFRAWFDEAEAESWKARGREAIERGVALDPDNPVVLVMLGTDFIGRGQEEKDPALLLAARHFLRLGQTEAEKISDRSQTTYFNSEWIPFWMPSAEKALAELTGSS